MQVNEELKIIISAQIDKLKENVDKAKKNVDGFKEQVKKASQDVDKNFKDIGTSIANGAKAAITGLAAASTALLALGGSTQEYRNEQAKLVSSFEAAGSSAEVAKDTYNDLFRVLGDSGQATEAAAHLAQLTTNEQSLAEWTEICQGVYATFGDSIPIEGLAEAANETAKTGQLTGSLADALNWAGINEEEFTDRLNKCVSESRREMMIRDTLNQIYGDAAATYEENNAQVLAQNEAQAKLQETTAKLGEAVAPVITAFTAFAADALAQVVPYIQQLAETYLPPLKELLGELAIKLGEAFNWVTQHKEVLAILGGVIGGITIAIGAYNAVAAIKNAMAVKEVATVWGLVAAYAAQAAAIIVAIAPYLLIVAAIAAVIAIVVLCVKHWDEIKEAVGKAWEWMKEKTMQAVDAIVNWFNRMKERANQALDALKSIVSSVFDGIKNNIKNKIETAKTIITNIVAAIKAIFTGDFGAAKEAVLNIFNAIVNGIKTKIETAKNTVKNVIDAIKGFFNFEWSLPKLKMPKVEIKGKFSLSPLEVPKFSISWNKLGGIFDKPTLFNYGGSLQGIGEDGAEAVVPLENNLGWLNKLADMLGDRLGGNTPITLTVDGKVFAETAINTINRQTRQSGKLALNLM